MVTPESGLVSTLRVVRAVSRGGRSSPTSRSADKPATSTELLGNLGLCSYLPPGPEAALRTCPWLQRPPLPHGSHGF